MYRDLDRPPLRPAALGRDLAADGWRLEVLATTGSTNAVVAERARVGEAAGLVVVAERQDEGRGRLGRVWVSPPGAGLTFSVLLRPSLLPQLRAADRAWLPLWGGLAVALALREQAGLDALLKWPNDVLVGGRKVCGLLAEAPSPDAVVMGIGLNVTTRRDELPHDGATSLRLELATTTDRGTVLKAVLRALSAVLSEPSRDGYRALCSSIGAQVRVELPGGGSHEGRAERVDDSGRLVVDGTPYAAADVVHLR